MDNQRNVYKKSALLIKVVQMYRAGETQKFIAKELQLQENTVGNWLKDTKLKIQQTENWITALSERLTEALKDPTTPVEKLDSLTKCIERMEARWFYKIK